MRKVKRLWGSVFNSPHILQEKVEELSRLHYDSKIRATVVGYDFEEAESFDPAAQIWIVVSCQLFEILLESGRDMRKKTVILVDNAILCTQYPSVILLDAERKSSFQFSRTPITVESLKRLVDSPQDSSTTRNRVDYIPALLEAQPPSILHPLMTFAYGIPDVDSRHKRISDVLNLVRAGSVDIRSLPWFTGNNSKQEALARWMESPKGTCAAIALGKALNKVKLKDTDAEMKVLAEEYGVSKFDIAYCVRFIQKHRCDSEYSIDQVFHESENRSQEF